MDRSTYPFPLAAHSSHHSHYHRFLLGADPAVVAPFPKPYCTGALSRDLAELSSSLDLQRWRKLYHASFPWVGGFGASHYDLGNVQAHRPLPREYSRPQRRYAAYDFVQVADPSVSALALVAGDRRVLERFFALGDAFLARLEEGACARDPGPSGSRATRRLLAGQFAEPNNRWLMPFLHVHARVLNFTSFEESPRILTCIDSSALARSGQKALQGWTRRQADALSELGYRASGRGNDQPELAVEGVTQKLIAATQAPRIAVLRLLERIILGEHPPSAERLGAELPPAVIAAMAEHIEVSLARSPGFHKPAKIGIPSEGPWRTAVRECLRCRCPGALSAIDGAAARAKATPYGAALFPTPPLDPAHGHSAMLDAFNAPWQAPGDPELGMVHTPPMLAAPASSWLVREFEATLAEVHLRIAVAGPDDPLVSLRGTLSRIDQVSEGASQEQLEQSRVLLEGELERRGRDDPKRPDGSPGAGIAARNRLVPLEQLFEDYMFSGRAPTRELGGRSL